MDREAPPQSSVAPPQQPRPDAAFWKLPGCVPPHHLQHGLAHGVVAPGAGHLVRPPASATHTAAIRPAFPAYDVIDARRAPSFMGAGAPGYLQPQFTQGARPAHDICSQHAALTEQSAAFAAHFTQMVAAAAAAGAMSAIQHCTGGAPLSTAGGHAAFDAAAHAAAMCAASRACELAPQAPAFLQDARLVVPGAMAPMPASAHMFHGREAYPAGTFDSHGPIIRGLTMANAGAAAAPQHAQPANGHAEAAARANGAAHPADVTTEMRAEQVGAETVKRSRSGRVLPGSGAPGQRLTQIMPTPYEEELVQKVQICAWLVR